MLVTTISSQSRQEITVTSEEAPRKESPEKTEATENTEANRWGIPWRIVGLIASGVAGFFITPYIQVGNDLTAHFIYAFMALTLYLFILLLIYLYAYKEELSGFIFKIFKTIKNFAHNIWEKLNSTKKLIRAFAIFAGLALLLLLIHNIIENSILHSEKIRNLPTGFNFSLKSNELSEIQNIRKSTFFYASGALLVALLLTLPFAKKLKFLLQEHILRIFVLTVIFGGILSFFIPAFLYNYEFIGDTKDLTTALFTITGGTIALFSLIKSHQKSELEREQLDTQKKKDARDHIRQVHSARRDRYIEAIDKLSSEYAPVRLGGVYALASLVDEWLDDDNIDRETQLKEGQVIINNLCAYIRSPFPLAAKINDLLADSEPTDYIGDFTSDQATLRNEQEVRQIIFTEISLRVKKIGRSKDSPYGPWGKFNFAFQGSNIFYPLNNLHLINADFRDSIFWGDSKISSTQFYGCTNLQGSTFQGSAFFSGVHFEKEAGFNDSIFKGDVKFSGVTFSENAMFPGVHFHGRLEIFRSTFWRTTTFLGANFFKKSVFNEAIFIGRTTFSGTNYCELFMHEKTKFYSPPVFHKDCIFFNSIFEKNAIFNGTVFRRKALFIKVKFESEPLFSKSQFNPLKRNKFTTQTHSKSIFIFGEPVIYNGCKYPRYDPIPAGAYLFDPGSWNEKQQKYIHVIDPAEPLENSDEEKSPE